MTFAVLSDRDKQWQSWYDQHGGVLLLLARRWVFDRSAAEDVAQEAFVRFWESRQRANDPTAYLYACVKNCSLEWTRREQSRKRREKAAASRTGESVEPMFVADLERDEFRAQVERALRRLPIEQSTVLVMKLWGGLTFPQVAEALGIPSNTAASRYRYAVKHLQKLIVEEPV